MQLATSISVHTKSESIIY